jgi:hypothetical protein
MPISDSPTEWDFLTLMSWWNLYCLPAVLVAAAALVFGRPVLRGLQVKTDARLDGMRIVRLAALIHLGLAIRSSIALAQQLLTFREMGVAESFASLVLAVLGVLVNPALAIGFWRRRPAAWWFAIAWYAFLTVIAILVIRWLLDYSVPFDPAWWPYHAAGKVLPLFLLFVMFLPRTRQAFAKKTKPDNKRIERDEELARVDAATPEERPGAPRWSLISVLTLWFLIVVVSTVAVESAEWIDRLVWPPE